MRLYLERRRDHGRESALEGRRRVGELLDVNRGTLRGWIERAEVDAGVQPGPRSVEHAGLVRLCEENAEFHRAKEILKNASALFGVVGTP